MDLRDPGPGMAPQRGDQDLTPDPELDLAAWIEAIDRESQAILRAVTRSGLDAPVPTCPDWQVRDLVHHLGGIHRWAAAHVAEHRSAQMPTDEASALMASHPDDESLLEWFEQGHQMLSQVLSAASADLSCWSFLPAPSPLAFWARRQAHETEIHRADVEFAAGSDTTPFPAQSAADGIEEMLFGFAPRWHRLKLESQFQIGLLPVERPDGWLVHLGPDGVRAQRGQEDAGCRVRGTSSNLYLLLWNRLPSESLEVEGNREALESWRRMIKVRWS